MMLEDLPSVLTVIRFALLFAGVVALAVWAARQPDQETALIERLTQRRGKSADT